MYSKKLFYLGTYNSVFFMQPFGVKIKSGPQKSHFKPYESGLHWQRPDDCSQSKREEPNAEQPHAVKLNEKEMFYVIVSTRTFLAFHDPGNNLRWHPKAPLAIRCSPQKPDTQWSHFFPPKPGRHRHCPRWSHSLL